VTDKNAPKQDAGADTGTALAPAQQNGSALAQRQTWAPLAELPPPDGDETPVAYVNRLMEMLPPPPGDAVDKIAAGILAAADLEDENQLWDSTGSQKLVGKTFIFRSVHISPSDLPDAPLDWFVIAFATDYETGEETVITSGSVNICTSLVKAQMLGNLPAAAEIMGPRRRLRSGRVPLHLRWMLQPRGAAGARPASGEVIDG